MNVPHISPQTPPPTPAVLRHMLLVTAWGVASCCLRQLSYTCSPALPDLAWLSAGHSSPPLSTTGSELSQQRHQHRHTVKCRVKVPACGELPAAPLENILRTKILRHTCCCDVSGTASWAIVCMCVGGVGGWGSGGLKTMTAQNTKPAIKGVMFCQAKRGTRQQPQNWGNRGPSCHQAVNHHLDTTGRQPAYHSHSATHRCALCWPWHHYPAHTRLLLRPVYRPAGLCNRRGPDQKPVWLLMKGNRGTPPKGSPNIPNHI